MKRELGIWRRLDHPNIVPLLGKARGEVFGSEHPCMVSMWMPHGTLAQYVNPGESLLPLRSRIQLVSARDCLTVTRFTIPPQVRGTTTGLEYRMSS